MINFTEPLALFIALLAFVLVLWFSYQSKKSVITGIMLFIFIAILVLHALEFSMGTLTQEGMQVAIQSIIFDLVFIFLSFISYLWIDDIQAKIENKKSIDDSLSWFWSTSSSKETKKVAKKA